MATMDFSFEEESPRNYIPIYSGINWHEKYMATHEKDNWHMFAHTVDRLGELSIQMTQDTCAFYINDTDPAFDCMVITDPRDEYSDFWYSRNDLGSEVFDELLDEAGNEVTLVYSKYPGRQVAEFVMNQLMEDSIIEIPDDWET